MSTDQANDALVRSFCDAWESQDLAAIMDFFGEGATYHNMPMEPCVGTADISAFIESFLAMASAMRFDIVHQVVAGPIVMNERIDTLVMGDNTVELPVAGVFEVVDGKIMQWRDYFDMGQFSGG